MNVLLSHSTDIQRFKNELGQLLLGAHLRRLRSSQPGVDSKRMVARQSLTASFEEPSYFLRS